MIQKTDTLDEMKKKYKLNERPISIAALHQILANKEATEDEFKVIFSLLLMGTILSPTSSVYIRCKYLHRV